jgi:hypothetical protein
MLRCLLRLLDKGMEYHDPLTDGEAVKRPSDALSSTWPQLEKPAAHISRVWHPHIWPKIHQQFHESRIVGQNAIRPTFYLGFDPCVEVFDSVRHRSKLANLITGVNGEEQTLLGAWQFVELVGCALKEQIANILEQGDSLKVEPPQAILCNPLWETAG